MNRRLDDELWLWRDPRVRERYSPKVICDYVQAYLITNLQACGCKVKCNNAPIRE